MRGGGGEGRGHAGEKWGAGTGVTPVSTEEQARGLLNKVPAGEL